MSSFILCARRAALTCNVDVCLKRMSFKKIGYMHRLNTLEKYLMVWLGKYKNFRDVPSVLSAPVVERARHRMRVRVANAMMLATAIACYFVAKSGKAARERGESLQQRSIDWHKQLRAEYQKGKESTT